MRRSVHRIDLRTDADMRHQLIQWACQFDHVCILDSHGNRDDNSRYEMLVAAGAIHTFVAEGQDDLEEFEIFRKERTDWLFGGLTYELRAQIAGMRCKLPDRFSIEPIRFFVPQHLFILQKGEWRYEGMGHVDVPVLLAEIEQTPKEVWSYELGEFRAGISRKEYEERLEAILGHIQRGDIYEMNFCQEFFAEDQEIDPVHVYTELSRRSRSPFSAFFKWNDQFLLSASPERYLQKQGDRLISQPIKGTRRRSGDQKEDDKLRMDLEKSQKDRSENVMIVDLVRNDLSRIAKAGSVKVEELYGIYTFPTVHQMISTVSCVPKEGMSFEDILRASYPMGSMTGAPKIRAMELIEEFESVQRSWYSGSVGYIDPQGDFDLNVVIRSIIYDQKRRLLSMQAGGAITIGSYVGDEYEECLVKADALFGALGYKERPSL